MSGKQLQPLFSCAMLIKSWIWLVIRPLFRRGLIIAFLLGASSYIFAQDQSCQEQLKQLQDALTQTKLERVAEILKDYDFSNSCTAKEKIEYHFLHGKYLLLKGQKEESLQAFQEVIDDGDVTQELKINALLETVELSTSTQKFSEAKQSLKQAKAIAAQLTPTNALLNGNLLRAEAELLASQGQPQAALDAYYNSCPFLGHPSDGDSIALAQTWTAMAQVFITQFELDSADTYLNRALDWQRSHLHEMHLHLADTYYYLGQLSFREKDHASALDLLKASMRIRQQVLGNTHALLGPIHNMIGLCYWRSGQLEDAITSLEKALAISLPISGEFNAQVASTRTNLGMVRSQHGMYEEAIEDLLAALKIKEFLFGPRHPQTIGIYNNLGLSYLKMERHEEAKEAFHDAYSRVVRAAPPFHPYPARIASNLARTYTTLLEFPEAMTWHQRALGHIIPGLSDDPFAPIPATQGPIAGELIEFLRYKGKTLLFKNEGQNPNVEEVTLALDIFSLCASLIDSLRLGFRAEASKFSYGEVAWLSYQGGIDAAKVLYEQTHDPKYVDLAFGFCERNKALILLEALQLEEALAEEYISEQIREQEISLRQQMATIQQDLYDLAVQQKEGEEKNKLEQALFVKRQSYDSLIQVLENEYPDYYAQKFDLSVLNLEQTRANLPDSTVWLEYFLGDEHMHLFCLTKDSTVWLTQEIRPNLSTEIDSFRRSIYLPFFEGKLPGPEQRYEYQGLDLYQEFLAPLIDRFPTLPQRWIVVTDGALGYLPFDALLTAPVEEVGKYANYPYLGKTYQISYSYSATLQEKLLVKQVPADRSNVAIAFAPGFAEQSTEGLRGEALRAGMSPLPFSLQEVKTISKLIDCEILTQSEASKENFIQLAPSYRLIHLSTHAKANDTESDLSQVSFVGPDSLTVHEIAALDLHAELVVLSACETGIGQLSRGEGILSLSRAFTYAGSQSLLTTLWNVNDATSSQIMTSFYEELVRNIPKDEALHRAKLAHLRENDHLLAHPFYWAGYALMGNTEAMQDIAHSFWLGWYVVVLCLGALLGFMIVHSQQVHIRSQKEEKKMNVGKS